MWQVAIGGASAILVQNLDTKGDGISTKMAITAQLSVKIAWV